MRRTWYLRKRWIGWCKCTAKSYISWPERLLTEVLRLRYHLRIWILLKAFNTLRNKKKRSMAGDSQQPAATQQEKEGEPTQSATTVRQLPPASARNPSTLTVKGASEASATPLPITSAELSPTQLPNPHASDRFSLQHPYSYTALGAQRETTSNGVAFNDIIPSNPKPTTVPSVEEADSNKDDAQNVTQEMCATAESHEDTTVKPPAAVLGAASTAPITQHQSQSFGGFIPMSGSSSAPDSIAPAPSILTAVDTINPLPLNEYWNERTWRRFTKSSPVHIGTFISCLGLVKCNVLGDTTFDHLAANAMSAAIDEIASGLYAKVSAESLVVCAANPDFLDEEIDVLLDEYAPDIWGMDADRSKLLEPGTNDTYPKNLVYENDDDRKLLWLYLHRWIFAKAFSTLRECGGSDEVERGVVVALSHGSSSTISSSVPERFYAQTLPGTEGEQDHKGKRKASIPPSPDQPKRPKGDQIHASQPENASSSQPNASSLTNTFVKYLQNCGQSSVLETTPLDSIEHELSQITMYLPSLLNTEPYAADFPSVFASWVTYRRSILAVRKQVTALPTEQLSDVQMKIRRGRLLTELRKARDEFLETRDDETSANDVICLGFGRLQRTVAEGEKVMDTIREGFRVLDERLLELGESLGGGKWILMG